MENITGVMELLMCVDLVDVTNLIGVGCLLRQYQSLEESSDLTISNADRDNFNVAVVNAMRAIMAGDAQAASSSHL